MLELLTQRREGPIRDRRKLGLVVEGGGMRGVYSAGALLALDFLGLRHVFDEVFAVSAGAFNACYFLSGQGPLGASVYYQDLCTWRFIATWRLHKLVDIDYLIEHVARVSKPLDTAAVLRSRARLWVPVLDAKTSECVLIDVKSSSTPLLQILKATVSIPVVYNRRVDVDGRRCIDGGLRCLLPVREAIDAGCTDILVLSTRTANYRAQPHPPISRFLFALLCARGNRHLLDAYDCAPDDANMRRALAEGRSSTDRDVNIATICPATASKAAVNRLTSDARIVRGALIAATTETFLLLGGDPAELSTRISNLA